MSTTPRIYFECDIGGHVELAADLFHHLARSRRLGVGDEFLTFNGTGTDRLWKVISLSDKVLEGELIHELKRDNPPRIDLTLAFSPLKGGRSDDVIAIGTQLGVNRFIPMMCSRTVVKLSGERSSERVERWNEICRQNSGFSLRSNVPVMSQVVKFGEMFDSADFDEKYIFYEEIRDTVSGLNVADGKSVLALIGPEGGFEESEVEAAKDAGFIPASLGPYILKADTAAIKAISIIIG
jgi:16S rRNA (uracil1498-N3)-methyltransferase